MGSECEPRRVALRYAPPGIIVEYTGSAQQLFHHEIDLQDALCKTSSSNGRTQLDIDRVVRELIAAHSHVLGERKVTSRQLVRLVRRLVDQTTSVSHTSASARDPHSLASTAVTTATAALPQADYNRVSETQLKQVKLKMDRVFEQNIVRPSDSAYRYDKQVAFTAPVEASDWDDE